MSKIAGAPKQADWQQRESFGSALVKIGVVAILLAAAVFFHWQRTKRVEEIAAIMKEARRSAQADNAADLKKALEALDRVLSLDSTSKDALALAADLNTQLAIHHRLDTEARAKELAGRAEQAGSRTEDRFAAHAFALLSAGQASQADSYIEDLRQQGASSAKLWEALGVAKQRLGQLALARQALNTAADKGWKNPRFSASAAAAALDEGNFSLSMEMADKAISANGEHQRARLIRTLAELYKRDGVLAKRAAETIADLTSQQDALSPGMKSLLLTAKAELAIYERSPDALQRATEAVTADPNSHLAHFAKARALASQNDPSAAAAFEAAVSRAPTAPLLYIEGARLLQLSGQLEPALALLDRYETTFKGIAVAVVGGPAVPALARDDRYYLARGELLRAAGKLDEASENFDKAIAAKNTLQARAVTAKASLLLAQKDYEKALELLAPAVPDDGSGHLPEAYLTMGDLLFAQKQYAAGCQNYGFALSRLRAQQAPREQLTSLLSDVQKRLVAASQGPMAKAWLDEGKALIQ